MADTTTAGETRRTDPAVLSHRRSPVQDLAGEMTAGSGDGVRLREIPFLTQVGLRVVLGTPAAETVESELGLSLPTAVGGITGEADGEGTLAVLWCSPDEFLLVGPDEATGESGTALAARLAAALGEEPGQAVDLSANRTTLELHGPHAREVLQKSCHLDLHPREFGVGRAVLTLLDSVPVVLWRTHEETWRVMPRASFAVHVTRWLLDGMKEFR